MAQQRKIKWTRTADLQYTGVLDFWLKRNKSSAYPRKLIELTSERLSQIARYPFIYQLSEYDNIRVTPLENFSIYYKVYNDLIIIVAFWDNRQNPDKLLDILQKDF